MKNKLKLLLILTTFLSFSSFAQLKILNGGRVGIGTNDVSMYHLHVTGDQNLQALKITTTSGAWGYGARVAAQDGNVKMWAGGLGFSDNFYALANGIIWNQNHYLFSDSILKKNISLIDKPIDKIKLLRGVYYNYKTIDEMDTSFGVNFSNDKRQIGLIAQEVKRALPEVVNENEKGLLGVSYSNIVALLIEGIKSQQLKIDSQAIQIQQLKEEITDLKGKTVYIDVDKTKLYQNDPNPFRDKTTFTYFVDENVTITSAVIEIRNLMGILQTSVPLNDRSGLGQVSFDGSALPIGYYVYSLKVNGSLKDSKMLLIGE
ncbi:MAG: tail fiber domain-containing protein [Bacteroidia bacterium]